MPTVTLTSKGQITVPAEVRRALGLERGDQLRFAPADGGYLVTPVKRSVTRLAGFFGPWEGPPVSIEQMNAAIAAGAAGEP